MQREATPPEQGQSREAVLPDVGVGRQPREELEQHDVQRGRSQVGLDAVPRHRDQAADDGGDVRAEHTERTAAHHRVGHPGLLAGLGDQVAQVVDDDDADQQRDQHLPTGQAEREEAARRDVPADAVHVGHPEREDVVRRPGLLGQWREVFVGQARVVVVLDQSAPDGMTCGFYDVARADDGARREISGIRHVREASDEIFRGRCLENMFLSGDCQPLLGLDESTGHY
jgi:hypothetical protein